LEQFHFPEGLHSLRRLYLGWNLLTGLALPTSVSQLSRLDLHGMPSLYGLQNLPPDWLVLPESISKLWVRLGYAGMSSGCAGEYYFREPVYFTYLGTHRPRITDFRTLGTGEAELTVVGDIGDRVSVEQTGGNEQFWNYTLNVENENGVEVIRVHQPQSESATVFFWVRLLQPVGGGGWPYVPYDGGGGEE
jgi:hypothetical protein